MNRRGDMNFMMVMLIVVLALAAVTFVIIGRGAKITSDTIDSAKLGDIKKQALQCRIASVGIPEDRPDGDKLADFCDPCIGGDDYKEQKDIDFVSDRCDENPKIPDSSPVMACCGNEPKGTPAEIISKCASGRLIALRTDPDFFQCRAKNTRPEDFT